MLLPRPIKRFRTMPCKFKDGYDTHLMYQEIKSSKKNGITGAHNLDEWKNAAPKVLEVQVNDHPSIDGIKQITYKMSAYDSKSTEPVGWREKEFSKTVYGS
ncbi:hypothetical protein [Lysinibacillus sp. 3P01SB]|uniref:hypothetical protein n=1 Tax=Lysinibacillus sp. 3P01SB TaxID=3132284 RepID=UPI0039A638D2